jgi:cellulose synthase/poly-beta-1,6-N-acetylglucosamine synthase-like glycosyltransferase
MDFWLILFIFDGILFVIIAGTVLYLGVFAMAALFHSKPIIPKAKKLNRFVILIPAYKQDNVIEQTVLAALSQAYPQRMFDVTVISDHQDELTNMRLAQYPITLLIPNFEESSKAKSLQYAILNLPEFKIYDAVIILDGDNIIDQDFLEQVNDAYEIAATKAIQTHRISKNRDTAAARMDAIFEEINNTIFRRGHISFGLSAALAGSGTVFDFNWYKTNVMRTKTSGEDKELEALLMRQDIFVDYFDHIYVYGEKKRTTTTLNEQRGRWAMQQFSNLFRNIRFLPGAIFRKQYNLADKLIQWMLVPRTNMIGVIMIMSIVLPFIYLTMAIKWWILGSLALFIFAIATPDYLVDEMWDKTFLRSPFVSLWKMFSFKIHKKS